jgi:hypothetical protein
METRTRKLDRDEWRSYFDGVSKRLGATRVNLIVIGLELGAQTEAQRVPLEGLTYDDDDDALDILLEGFEHRIGAPRQIHVQEDASGRLVSFRVEDGEGHEQILQLDPSLVLAAS